MRSSSPSSIRSRGTSSIRSRGTSGRAARRVASGSSSRIASGSSARRFGTSEVRRLRAHFREVLGELDGRDVGHLPAAQRARRRALIAELGAYAARGLFPKNLDFRDRPMPYFIDQFGTRCAMAHLIESAGGADLVARVARAANNAFVPELAADAELLAWLEQAGLSLAEAARIQPSYCPLIADLCFCAGNNPASATVIEGVVTANLDGGMLTAVVLKVHGDPSPITACGEVTLTGTLGVGHTFIAKLGDPGQSWVFPLNTDDSVVMGCDSAVVPVLQKEDAIAALLAGMDNWQCVQHLTTVDNAWYYEECNVLAVPPDEDGTAVGDASTCGMGGAGGQASTGGAGGQASTGGTGGSSTGGGGAEVTGGTGGAGGGGGDGGKDVPITGGCAAGCTIGILPAGAELAPWMIAAGVLWARRRRGEPRGRAGRRAR
jgi:hypothetical protein